MAYNPVPGYPNCFYDTVKKEHVWTLLVPGTSKWRTDTPKGYAKNNCQDAYTAFKSQSAGTRVKTPVPQRQTNPNLAGRIKGTVSNCFVKNTNLATPGKGFTLCWESSNKLHCEGAPENRPANLVDAANFRQYVPDASSCQHIRDAWLSRFSSGGSNVGKPPSGSIGSSESCEGCSPLDMGCQIGKQFCEFQAWLAKNVGGAALPAVAVTGVIVLLLALKR